DEVIECGWNCVYNSQTSSMNYHLGSVHKKYKEKSAIKELISESCNNAAITTDLWMSYAKDGYIRITCYWLNNNMELYDILI
ncbi:28855_t:CDS:2, partial [Gigaspora margarita]